MINEIMTFKIPKIRPQSNPVLQSAYTFCQNLVRSHYENFPVASIAIPKKLRIPISVIYAFGRSADDIADEGSFTEQERLSRLDYYFKRLQERISLDQAPFTEQNKTPNHANKEDLIFLALHHVIQENQLPVDLFVDQLVAFKQDITKKQYQSFNEILEYCQRSANPIGRLLLYLTNSATELNLYYSDCICTAIQLINFLQDLESDLQIRDRCYLPMDAMQAVGLSLEELKTNPTIGNSSKLKTIVHAQLWKIEHLLEQGRPLLSVLKGRIGLELRLTWVCAFKMIEKLKKRSNHFERPKLQKRDWPLLIIQALKEL